MRRAGGARVTREVVRHVEIPDGRVLMGCFVWPRSVGSASRKTVVREALGYEAIDR